MVSQNVSSALNAVNGRSRTHVSPRHLPHLSAQQALRGLQQAERRMERCVKLTDRLAAIHSSRTILTVKDVVDIARVVVDLRSRLCMLPCPVDDKLERVRV